MTGVDPFGFRASRSVDTTLTYGYTTIDAIRNKRMENLVLLKASIRRALGKHGHSNIPG